MIPAIYFYTQDSGLLRHWQASFDGVELPQQEWAHAAGSIAVIDSQYPMLPAWNEPIWQQRMQHQYVIVVNTCPNDEEGYAVLLAGAAAYCHAAAPKELLQQVISAVISGEIWAGRSLVLRLLNAVNRLPAKPDPLLVLSDREREVAHAAARGQSNKEIARALNITERTVKAHLSACFEKLGVSDRVQLTLRVNGIN
ncbi:response regulator transcription factor [Deefgea salmonis]|uniref:Response regulator transcription factor n=1 Tax=Deefgea salmonis TaxID=2875502 RepID=A0ABS8BM29_9NEIS|nr:response regulator transcription factor [Deefgea salmonis]MCB5196782.1 response regulator transcription factor [Deefgea salmonis]